jgi:hypothetical protein
MRVERYAAHHRAPWDDFVRSSKNGVFLFERDYLEYHADRFSDHSLTFWRDDRLAALLPANLGDGDTLISHGGLTFGGFVVDGSMKQMRMLDVFTSLRAYCLERGIARLIYKPVPYIYHRGPSQEDLYALYVHGARLSDRRSSTVVADAPGLPRARQYEARKAQKAGVVVGESADLASYWHLLDEVLRERHGAKPVHTLDEITRLRMLFPRHIRLFAAYEGDRQGEMLAGALVCESERVARTQYLASGERGRKVGALDLLLDHLIHEIYRDKAYVDFGTSVDPVTDEINGGLMAHKEDFGGRTVVCDTYRIEW